jgi:ribonucleoside-diphosphate reductase alpha chain
MKEDTTGSKQKEVINFLDEIANFTFTSKYARYNNLHSRRETWEECINRVQKMHLDKFRKLPKEDLDEIKAAFDLVKEKAVVPSMRSMQFGGKAILAHNSRMFNCSVRHIDSIRSFSESFYLLLCGCGVGFTSSIDYRIWWILWINPERL